MRSKAKVKLLRIFVNYLKSKGCVKCGFNNDITKITFHHLDPVNKVKTISRLVASGMVEKLQKELKKCIMLCEECHKKEHEHEDKEIQEARRLERKKRGILNVR